MKRNIPFEDLPEKLDPLRAVQIAYEDGFQSLEYALRNGQSVLLECDKAVITSAYRIIRDRLKEERDRVKYQCAYVDGRAIQAPLGPIARMMRQLENELQQDSTGRIVVIPHLDVMATTTQSGLTGDARETLALLAENPEAVVLAFCDPSLSLPEAIENLFPRRIRMIGISREALPRLVERDEARKFSVDGLDSYRLFKYVSGLNPVRLRKILSGLKGMIDADPARPESANLIYRQLRESTRLHDMELPQVDLDRDIGGYPNVKDRLRKEIVDLLARRDHADLDACRSIENLIPRGIIFWGPPGTGKTYFAKAIATAIDAVVTVVSGPELKSKWVGESEANLRRVFADARKAAPSIIIFDELDSFATRRGTYVSSGAEHSMVNQLLTEMDGFRKEELVFVVGTTNFVESLDPALLRPGRFELAIHIPAPDPDDRRAIIRIYRDRFQLDMDDATVEYAVRRTAGPPSDRSGTSYTGDHLNALCRGAKREELRRGALKVTPDEIDRLLRREEPAKLLAEEERVVAVHECGHALIAMKMGRGKSVEKITLIPDNPDALGSVVQRAREGRYVMTEGDLRNEICVLLAGRESERLVFNEVSCGAWQDLKSALSIARVMVEEFGMGPGGGARTVVLQENRRDASDGARNRIDEAIAGIVETEEKRAREILAGSRAAIDRVVQALLVKRELKEDELRELLDEHHNHTA